VADVILKNTTKHPKRMLVFNLTREISPVKVTNRTTVETRDGERRKKQSSKLVPDSVRIPYGTEVTVSAACLQVPEIAAAVERRELKVRPVPQDAGPKPAKAPATEVKTAPKGKERRRK